MKSAPDYHEIRAALIHDYAPATSQELMLVDQIAAGYWRTIRARRFETAMFDNQLRAKKHEYDMDPRPNSRDDEGCAVILQIESPESLKNTIGMMALSRTTTTAPLLRSSTCRPVGVAKKTARSARPARKPGSVNAS